MSILSLRPIALCGLMLAPAALLLAQPASSAATCTDPAAFDPYASPVWNGWGGDASNVRFQNEAGAQLSAAQVPILKLKWAFGFPEARSVMGQPSMIGGRVFIGVDTGEVYSLDAETGCTYWMFKADASVRTAAVFGPVRAGRPLIAYFGDLQANVYAVNAATGQLMWKTQVDDHSSARITGGPRVAFDKLIVPVSSGEEGAGANPTYPCCTFRGSVVALDLATGVQAWKTYMIAEEARQTGTSENGTARFGPSGAAIWSSPTFDPLTRTIYVATGDAYSEPADMATDAVVALTLDTGEIQWISQATPDDIWVTSCMRPGAPEDCGPDHDFGSPGMLKTFANGRRLLIAGQKSGNVWAYDPDTGEVVWRTPLVEDTTQFGGKIIWGGAADDRRAYFGIGPGGIGAVQLQDGELQWFTELQPAAGLERYAGQDGPITAIDGAIFSGGWDGVVRALSSDDGHVIWEYDTVRDFEAVNSVAAKGGSMGAAGPIVGNGTLFVPSGYIGVRGGMSGNVLLAFGVEE